MSDQAILTAVEAAWRRAAFRCGSRVDPWAFLRVFRAELSLELAEHWAEQQGMLH